MKRIYEFITKANQVLLFVAGLGVLVAIAFGIISQCTGDGHPPSLPIAQTGTVAHPVPVSDLEVLGRVGNIWVLGVKKEAVDVREQEPAAKAMQLFSSSLGSRPSGASMMVNIVFSSGDKKLRALLPQDGVILDSDLPREDHDEKFSLGVFLFLCATEDTNGDHCLGRSDRNDLWVVARDLRQPDWVIPGVLEYRPWGKDHATVKIRSGDTIQLFDLDLVARTKQEITWR